MAITESSKVEQTVLVERLADTETDGEGHEQVGVTRTNDRPHHRTSGNSETGGSPERITSNVSLTSLVWAENEEVYIVGSRWSQVSFMALPDWLRDNSYLWNHHRPPLGSIKRCMGSIFRLHSETGNIWTHLLGWIAVHIYAVYAYAEPLSQLAWKDKLIFGGFLVGAWCCLLFSWLFHTPQCHSPKVFRVSSRLDYLGVALLIMSSFYAWVYYAFDCHRNAQIVYMALMTVVGIAAVIVSLWNKFSTPKYRPLRAIVFLTVGLYGVIPAAHAIAIYGLDSSMFRTAAVGQMALMGSFYILGVVIYTTRVPERFFPGKCDLFFHSHQVFHICVVIGAFLHGHDIVRMATAHSRVTC